VSHSEPEGSSSSWGATRGPHSATYVLFAFGDVWCGSVRSIQELAGHQWHSIGANDGSELCALGRAASRTRYRVRFTLTMTG
jgi:hypothetical protein